MNLGIKKKMRYNLVLNDRGFYEFKFSESTRIRNKQITIVILNVVATSFRLNLFKNKQIRKSKHIVYSAINKYLNE